MTDVTQQLADQDSQSAPCAGRLHLRPADRDALIEALAGALVDDYLAADEQLAGPSADSPTGSDQTAGAGRDGAAA